nr:unnamed protein product [Digitaria exilis]
MRAKNRHDGPAAAGPARATAADSARLGAVAAATSWWGLPRGRGVVGAMRRHLAGDVDPVAPLELGAVPQQPLGLVGLEQAHDAALSPLVPLLRRRGRCQRRRVGVGEAGVHGERADAGTEKGAPNLAAPQQVNCG